MTKKRGGLKKRVIPFGIVVLAGAYTFWSLTQPLLSIQPSQKLTVASLPASKVTLDWPDYGQSAVGVPGYGVLATDGEQKPLATASIAKVLTAMAVLRQKPLKVGEQGPDIIINQADIDTYNEFVAGDGSVVGVALGERISEYQALQALLLPSANNMAVTLARWAFGSVEAYNTYVNDYAKQLGLRSVHSTDPSGYDVKTVASAQDLTLLGSVAMLNPVFVEIVGQSSATIPVEGKIYNYNFQLGKNGNIGIKTGNNDGNLGAFLFANKLTVDGQELTVVGTIMDAPDLSTALEDSGPLAVSAAKGLQRSSFVTNGQRLGTYTLPDQGPVDVVADGAIAFPTWAGTSYRSVVTLNDISGALPAGAEVGHVTVTNSATGAANTVPIRIKSAVRTPSVLWRLTHPLGS